MIKEFKLIFQLFFLFFFTCTNFSVHTLVTVVEKKIYVKHIIYQPCQTNF